MSDELLIVPEAPEVDETPAEDAPDPKAEELAAKEAKLAEWEKSLNKKSSELGAIAKQLETAPKPAAPAADDDVAFDEAELKTLKAALKHIGLDPDAIARATTVASAAVADELSEVAEDFFAKNTDIPAEDIIKHLYDDGVDVDNITPARLRRELARAHKAIVVERTDVQAEAKKLAEQMIAEMTKDGDVVAVKKGRANATGGHKTLEDALNDPGLSPFEKMKLAGNVNLD